MSSDLAELIKHDVGIRSLRKNPKFLEICCILMLVMDAR